MKRLGRASEPLKPYDGMVRSCSGHCLHIRGWMALPIRLGSLEITMNLVVADRLHCDAILGGDALGAFGAVIDIAERTMILKSTQEVLALGVTVVQDTYMTAMAVSVRLPPRGEALETTNVIGEAADNATVLVEGSLGLPPTLCVARTLCTVQNGQVIVEVCNASTDAPSEGDPEGEPRVVGSVAEERKDHIERAVMASKPDILPDKGVVADFSDTKLSEEQKTLLQEELNAFSDLLVESSKKPGRTDLLKFEIDTGNNRPIKQQPYRVSVAEREIIEAEVGEYLDLGLIRPSNSPWASPVLMIRKPDGGIRFCIGYRRLNAMNVKDCYPMPLIDDILDVLGDARLFSTMDIASGYLNVPMHENSVAKTAFTCKYGLYEWSVMPFGLCNAVPAFERSMETVHVDLKWRVCLVYLDDCVIFCQDFPSHLVRVRQVLTRFRHAGFKLKMKKCHWGRSQQVVDWTKHKSWITKQDGVSEIEYWGVVWATRKFRCYLDKREFDVFTDHQALPWVFNPGNRTGNAKLTRWAMEPSNLQFKVHYKPGTAMGHVDGLSRLPMKNVNALTMADLLNPERPNENGVPSSVGEPSETAPEPEAAGPDSDKQTSATPVAPTSVDVFGLNSELFLEEQQEVSWIRALVALLQDGALPLDPFLRRRIVQMAPKYCVVNGLLMRTVHLPANVGSASTVTVPVLPLPFVNTLLHLCQRDLLSSHLGLTKTHNKFRRHAYWPEWRKDVAEYLRGCMKCGGGKGPRPGTYGRMQRMPVADLTGPFSLLVVDAVGPLPETKRGNTCILVFVDYFTRWAEAFAVGALASLTFVDAMVNGSVSRHGVPSRLLSDNGRNFTSDVAKSFYQTLGIKKLFGAAYHPQTQGLVERFNGTFIGMLRLHVDKAQTDWVVYLPRVLFTYRTAYHEALGDTPFFTLYGRDPVLPLDVAFPNLGKKWKSDEVALYRRREQCRSLKDLRHLVERQLVRAQDRHEQSLRNQVEVQFEVGDPVWVYQVFRSKCGEKLTKKLAFSWHGPYRVMGRVGENAYRIDIPSHSDKVVTINVKTMKKFRGRWSQPYLDEIPDGVDRNEEAEDGPLEETVLSASSFTERLAVGRDYVAFTGTDASLLEVVAKRVVNRKAEYLALTATYETFWLPRSALMPVYLELVHAFERSERMKKGLPVLRRSVRLADANERVEGDDLLLV
ncbi:unnamed protein product [Phytophthora fragariaefolia]|uniref:RNA-directed DNA polymerase n=1 Tax=Phytophthora fragariaefolia TaxID=1490495 RepID=A0A9W7CSU8_9STRA|nr:unnamed protein product [Phytophthora fragariaefolia]